MRSFLHSDHNYQSVPVSFGRKSAEERCHPPEKYAGNATASNENERS